MQSELPGMVDLLRNHPNTMVLFSANGVLPGNSATGATGTYNPPSMTCSNGCGLDGSGCGSQGNSFDIDICSLKVGPIVPTPTPPTPVTKPTRAPQRAPTKPPQSSPTPAPVTPKPPPGGGDDLNGEEACENNGFNKNECKNVGNDNTSCCQWDSGECYSNIGRESCPGTGTTNNIFSPSPPNNNGSCVDSSFKFKVTVKGKTRNKNCKWVRKNKTEKKCNFSGVRETCRKTCNGCE
ncbi:hypothetical protein FRACYDRAFT_236295 [Fragilariopsis cylindrus CCMP1102]|uniref:Uncharacterized protein n=1 Tax=Fragilariopsis cylindrus CCMP1102 TaxID=635003 RepID=A0A1E7FQZ1_9STRA|nr:hypothetical protein FRACYDRAFT_236295 [Fragilariopsis cylindrus CCMP1102]|eukprot:OEU20223.1 hypothetical protein FRACYDRAFT_236295 [Fragilariopsis cylindrus CCMP1102]